MRAELIFREEQFPFPELTMLLLSSLFYMATFIMPKIQANSTDFYFKSIHSFNNCLWNSIFQAQLQELGFNRKQESIILPVVIFIILATNYLILSNIIISLKKLGQFLLSKLVLLEFNSFNKNTKLHENQHQPYSHNLTAFGAGSFLLYFILVFLKVYPKQKNYFSPSWKDIPFNHVFILGGSHVRCEEEWAQPATWPNQPSGK